MFAPCPNCRATVPAGQAQCQFCGAALAAIAPAKGSIWHDDAADPASRGPYRRPTWVPLAYNLVSAYIGLSGLVQLVTGGVHIARDNWVGYIEVVMGTIGLVLGVGLLLKIEFIRGVVNFVCGISILFGIFGLLAGFPFMMALGFVGLLWLLQSVFNLATNAAMIYLVGETD